MSVKICFMHYRNYITWTRVKSPVAFDEFDMFFLFWPLFPFHYHCQFVKGQLDQKSIFAFSLIEIIPSFVEAFVFGLAALIYLALSYIFFFSFILTQLLYLLILFEQRTLELQLYVSFKVELIFRTLTCPAEPPNIFC